MNKISFKKNQLKHFIKMMNNKFRNKKLNRNIKMINL